MKLTNVLKVLCVVACLFCLLQPLSFASTVRCPEYSVELTGTSVGPGGVRYTEHLVLHKVAGSGPWYRGRWVVDSFGQDIVYPWDLRFALKTNDRVELGHGFWMQCKAVLGGNVVKTHCPEGNLTLDVVGNKIGMIRSNVWIGTITGNTMSLKFDQGNPYEPVITGQIGRATGGHLSLDIVPEQSDPRYVFSEDSPGKLKMKFKANLTPSDAASNVKWTLPDLGSSHRSVVPASLQGESVDVTFTDLPQRNSDFGEKTITASVKVGSCEVSDTEKIKVYFPRDAKNSPDDHVPNWFYYWSQTSAKKGPAVYGGMTSFCATQENRTDGCIGYYRNEILDSKYYICDLSKLGSTFPFMKVIWTASTTDQEAVTGIDTFGVASYHENGHYTHFKDWWFAHRATHPFDPAEDLNKNSIKDTVESAKDVDGDLIPDALEPGLGFNPTKKYTYPVEDDDEEILTWQVESTWVVGSANKEDWAKPGKQW